MGDHTPNMIGVDISKTHLDAHALPSGRAARFSNQRRRGSRSWRRGPVDMLPSVRAILTRCNIFKLHRTAPWTSGVNLQSESPP